jgi:hypothetical protein
MARVYTQRRGGLFPCPQPRTIAATEPLALAKAMDAAFDAYNLRAAGTLVPGRRTFEMFRGFWPQVQHAARSSPRAARVLAGERCDAQLVVSNSLSIEAGSPWSEACALGRQEAVVELAKAKAAGDKGLLVVGSRTLGTAFRRQCLSMNCT